MEKKFPARLREPHFLVGGFTQGEDGALQILSESGTSREIRRGSFQEATEKPRRPVVTFGELEAKERGKSKKKKEEESLKLSEDSGPPDSEFVVPTVGILVPRHVAIHRVKWNPNEAFRTWLAYGSQSGLVRCQLVRELQPK